MITYTGTRTDRGCVVRIVEPGQRTRSLAVYRRVFNHSPDGFEWGYGGSGPAQLALALCIHALDGDRERAISIHQDFKFRHVGRFPYLRWTMTKDAVVAAIVELEAERTNEQRP